MTTMSAPGLASATQRGIFLVACSAIIWSFGGAIARLPAAVARYRKMVEDLGDAPVDIERGREALREILGEVQIAPHEGHLVAKMALSIDSQALACGCGSGGRI